MVCPLELRAVTRECVLSQLIEINMVRKAGKLQRISYSNFN
jgi:hypothetical protein